MNMKQKLALKKIKYLSLYFLLIALLLLATFWSLCSGAMPISVSDVLSVMGEKLLGGNKGTADNVTAVIWEIRLPRIICSVFVGMGLAVAGVIFQGILKNPLADPYTLGISTGASFGAALAIIINLNLGIFFPTSVAALIGAAFTLFCVIAISRRGSGFESSNLIIAGIIVSSILSSGVSFMKMLAGENVGAIVFWIMGSFSAVTMDNAVFLVPMVVICMIFAFCISRRLDIMSLGDDNAKALGINVDIDRLIFLITGSVLSGICVSVCGVIGFVGLIVPHLLRFAVTAENKVLMPMSALLGGFLLLLADSGARLISKGEVPVGVITTLIGGPFFIFVFMRRGVLRNG